MTSSYAKEKGKIVYLVPDVGISGGIAVVLNHANRLRDRGYDTLILTLDKRKRSVDWMNNNVPIITLNEADGMLNNIYMVVATHWSTVKHLNKIPSLRKIYFVQSDERRFEPNQENIKLVENTYREKLEYMTEAIWIQRWLKEEFGHDAFYVPNGLDSNLFYQVDPIIKKSVKPRILLEGPVDVWFKGMEIAYEAVKDIDCEIWIVCASGKPKFGWRYDSFFYRVPLSEMKKMYSSCDIFLKMSKVEGFFGPPLEAMACGCAVVTGKVTGYDEYIKDGVNALVVDQGSSASAKEAIQKLIADRNLRKNIIQNGFKTARDWSWKRSTDFMEKVIQNEKIEKYYTENFPERYDYKNELAKLKKDYEPIDRILTVERHEIEKLSNMVRKRDKEIRSLNDLLHLKISQLENMEKNLRITSAINTRNVSLSDIFIYYKGKTKGFFQKYYGLAKMSFEELRFNGWEGLMFAYRRHMKKKRGEIPVEYARYDDHMPGLVSIGILSIDHLELIKPCLESIEKNLSEKYKVEILVGDTGTKEKEVWNFYKEAKRKWKNVKIVKIGKYFFCKNYNDLFSQYAKGQYLILLNNDTIVKGSWIDSLVDPLEDKQIGLVGGKLLYQNETIQHAGMEFRNGNAIAVYAKEKKDLPETSFKAFVPVTTFACAAVRHDVYNRFKMDENYREEAQDTDFCLRLREAGYKILYNPECEIYHLECSTRDWRKGERDRIILNKQWGDLIGKIASGGFQRKRFDPDEYKNSITVIRDDGIGDLLMGVCAFQKLREKYPDKKLILATYARNVEMMAGFGIFDELIPIPNGMKYAPLPIPKDSKIFKLIDLEMDFKPMHGKPLETNKTHRHEVFSEIMGLGQSPYALIPMPDYPEARKNIEKLFKKEGIDINQKFVVFSLLASNPARSWWEPYYPQLIKAVEDAGFIPVMVGTKDSKYYQGKKVVNLVGKTKKIAEFIEVIKLGKYVISTDTSAYHIAALSGIPFLAIFTGGVKPEARVSHYEKYEVLEPPASLECYPCWDEGCTDLSVRWKKDPCRLIIKPEEAIDKFKKLVEKYRL